ncbi:MAG: secondary thiamine-phosphate synthase enzyme YjbQ [Candidatus Cloacimonetes bacterium]|nr:secondary thiamine-phosphate synthase enzyme YjbQ [Candidatus Cloacimonadota bacterium]
MKKKEITIISHSRNEMIDITAQVRRAVSDMSLLNGSITLYVPHTTAAVTINEHADPSVQQDIILALNRISPVLKEFRHLEGNSDSHLKSSLIGCSQEVIIENGNLFLGTWQGIFFCEFDGPRTRHLYIFCH